ncbi:MAG: hypothetical protein NUV65_02705 [Candidatus Roizmanbacteria bacterium]|nr:hypothetical protein [Candidatus Roizmanbacteria bacterium]
MSADHGQFNSIRYWDTESHNILRAHPASLADYGIKTSLDFIDRTELLVNSHDPVLPIYKLDANSAICLGSVPPLPSMLTRDITVGMAKSREPYIYSHSSEDGRYLTIFGADKLIHIGLYTVSDTGAYGVQHMTTGGSKLRSGAVVPILPEEYGRENAQRITMLNIGGNSFLIVNANRQLTQEDFELWRAIEQGSSDSGRTSRETMQRAATAGIQIPPLERIQQILVKT